MRYWTHFYSETEDKFHLRDSTVDIRDRSNLSCYFACESNLLLYLLGEDL